ncbi:cadmium resistance transporter [Anabaena sp. FACHB-1237]|uniref:cadmium resistance transporter n=1 Tax=Anabaena sp. FACHB-1237 TaxID=2692769 RepID=UPI0016814301|nr:cadmium resistance transporter [Anabaena sp. FACHB-1237]MBD2136553.1 cadmium resistance transporter [Anabaena sp. FACHB-1237]
MNDLLTTITTGIVAFMGTNIDDLIILLLFFSQINDNLKIWEVVCGQYLGFTILVFLSLPGLFSGLIFPPQLIGLLGLIPLAIGISSLVNENIDSSLEVPISTTSITTNNTNFLNPQIYTVAVITIANGSDNISIYIPLFSSTNLENFLIIITIFFLLLASWCYLGYKLTHQQKIADFFTNYGNYLIPFVLIGLGAFIVWKSNALSPMKIIGSCLCLWVLMKKS